MSMVETVIFLSFQGQRQGVHSLTNLNDRRRFFAEVDRRIASKEPFQIFQKEIELKASFINPYTQKRALDLIDSGRLDVTSMVCEICGLEKLEEVLSSPALRANGKYLISAEL